MRKALEKVSKLFSVSYGKARPRYAPSAAKATPCYAQVLLQIGCDIGAKFTDERQMFDFALAGKPYPVRARLMLCATSA